MEHNMPPQPEKEPQNTKSAPRYHRFTTKGLLITLLIIVVLFAAIWIWKTIEINSLEKKQAEREQELKTQAQTMLVQADMEALKLMAKPYVWAVRTEMLNGNIGQINLYANDMVKQANFQSIVVADNSGTIVSSTDKKYEGQPFSSAGKEDYLRVNQTVVEKVGDSLLVMASPVMGFNSRLGTLMIHYVSESPEFK